ncbi:MAG: hypothetical protein ABL950_01495 [Nitrospira sp.]
MSRTPSQEKQTRHKRTPLPPSMLDQMEAMVRHPEFRRSVQLWQSIFGENYKGLTEEEERERDAPRTKIQKAAIMEADQKWLSRSIEDIKRRAEDLREKAKQKLSEQTKPTDAIWTEAEAQWALDAVNGEWGDQSNALAPILPADISSVFKLRYVKESTAQHQEQTGLKPIQFPRRPSIDPWKIYDMMQEPRATPAKVRDQIFGPYDSLDRRYKTQKPPRSANIKARVKADLKKVQNAYRYALKVFNSLNIL